MTESEAYYVSSLWATGDGGQDIYSFVVEGKPQLRRAVRDLAVNDHVTKLRFVGGERLPGGFAEGYVVKAGGEIIDGEDFGLRTAQDQRSKMTKYQIENPRSGVILGIYEAASERDALDAMASDAGYGSYAEACEVAPEDDLTVHEVTDDQDRR